ncbi:MAG: hypothetical protein ACOCU2_02480 [Bacillota bacterium]
MKKIIITLSVIIAMTLVYFFVSSYTPYDEGDPDGHMTVMVINRHGNTVIDDTFAFYDDDTLYDILHSNYHVESKSMDLTIWNENTLSFNQVSSRIILSIGSVETDFETAYLKISIKRPLSDDPNTYDTEVAKTGVDGLPLYDDATYIFEYERISMGGDTS